MIMDTLSNCSCAAFTYEFKYIEFNTFQELVVYLNSLLPGSGVVLTEKSVVDVQIIKLNLNNCIVKLVYFDPVINEI